MTIVGTFPLTLQNGTQEDATQVMSLFAYIQSQVNGNACPATTGSTVLKGDGAGGTVSAVAGTDYQIPIAAGVMVDYGGAVAPTGWLLCDGSAVSRATYAALFTAIGTTWGAGDGSTTFNLPNMARRTSVGSGGSGTGTLGNTVGSTGGEETHVLTVAELAAHNHGITDPTHAHGITDPSHFHSQGGDTLHAGGGTQAVGAGTNAFFHDNTAAATTGISINAAFTGITIQNNGSGTAHNNMQPSAVVLKIIKT